MNLSQVIAELSSELESLDQVIVSLEKLAEIRARRTGTERQMATASASQKIPTEREGIAVSARQREN